MCLAWHYASFGLEGKCNPTKLPLYFPCVTCQKTKAHKIYFAYSRAKYIIETSRLTRDDVKRNKLDVNKINAGTSTFHHPSNDISTSFIAWESERGVKVNSGPLDPTIACQHRTLPAPRKQYSFYCALRFLWPQTLLASRWKAWNTAMDAR